MRVFAACALAIAIGASPAMAGGGGTTPAIPANSPAPAATSAEPASSPTPARPAVETELQQLRELLESQARQSQLENQELRDQLREQRERMRLLEEELSATKEARENPEAESALVEPAAGIGPSVAIANAAANSAAGQEKPAPPTSIAFKGVTLTPGGFFAAESVWRQKALSADVNTPFNANPFNGSSNAHISEFNASGRPTRITMLVQGKLSNANLSGYYETDFQSAGVTSNNNQSNSYTLRQRQAWAQAAFNNGWTITGGQMWSLVTETTKGMDNRTEAVPLVIDHQYNVGFSWARQYGMRITKNFNNKVWLGFSVENGQSTLTVHGNPTAQAAAPPLACTTPGVNGCSAGGTITINTNPTFVNFLVGQFGAGGGLYNATANYAFNRSPDFVFKAAFEPGFGHYEVFGVLSQFRDRAFPCVLNPGVAGDGACNGSTTSPFGAFSDSRTGGGGGANARWSVFNKKVDFGLHGFAGSGIGRYGSVGLPDATVRPDGTLALLRNYQALSTLQFHPTPKLDVYFNVGGEYSDRAQYIKSGVVPNEGYGVASRRNDGCFAEVLPLNSPSTKTDLGVPTGVGGSAGFITGPLNNCDGDSRNVIEGTMGFAYRFYRGPMGTVQYAMQYSNWVRNTWRGAGGIAPHSDNNMVLTSFRYYLP
jgi:hypothetical protein